MIDAVLEALAATPIAASLRASTWTYPVVNALHILGIGLLIGSIAPLDLRLLGLWKSVPAMASARVLTPVAGTGLGLALVTGALLFSVKPLDYAALELFQAKLLLILAGLANIGLVARSPGWRRLGAGKAEDADALLRAAAALSLALWLAALLCGRLIAYRL